MIPCLTSAGDGVWRPGHGGQRRRCYKAGGGGARGAKEELGRRRWLLVAAVFSLAGGAGGRRILAGPTCSCGDRVEGLHDTGMRLSSSRL